MLNRSPPPFQLRITASASAKVLYDIELLRPINIERPFDCKRKVSKKGRLSATHSLSPKDLHPATDVFVLTALSLPLSHYPEYPLHTLSPYYPQPLHSLP